MTKTADAKTVALSECLEARTQDAQRPANTRPVQASTRAFLTSKTSGKAHVIIVNKHQLRPSQSDSTAE